MRTKKITRMYYTNSEIYSEQPIYPVNIDISVIDEIVYSFFKISDDYKVVSSDRWADSEKRFIDYETSAKPLDDYLSENETYHGCLNQFRKICSEGNTKLLLGLIDTPESCKIFSRLILSEKDRSLLLESLLEKIKFFGIFSGVLVNISGTIVLNSDSLMLFLSELKEKIVVDNNIENFSINLLMSANQTNLQFSEIKEIIDTFEIIGYHFDSHLANHYSYLYKNNYSDFSIENAIDNLTTKNSITISKIILGMTNCNIMYTNTDGPSHIYSERKFVALNQELSNYNFKYFWDNSTKSSLLYDPLKKVLIVYENENSIYEKCRYVKENGLVGASLNKYDHQNIQKINHFLQENCEIPIVPSNYTVINFWTENNIDYLIGNIVYHKTCEYTCIKDHTSSIIDEPGAGTEKWKKMCITTEISPKDTEPTACKECNRKIKSIRFFGEIDFSKIQIIYE